MHQLIIIGAGGFGREVLAWARQSPDCGRAWTIKGFLDDNPAALTGFAVDVPILGTPESYALQPRDRFICAIGSVAAKKKCIEAVRARGGEFTSLVHPTAVLGDRVRLGAGVILCPLAIVSTDAALGDFVTINYHSTVAHDAVIGDFTQVHCHADITGSVRIGREVLIGSHASILPGVCIGDLATVGAGSLVGRDVPPGATVLGNPARVVGMRE